MEIYSLACTSPMRQSAKVWSVGYTMHQHLGTTSNRNALTKYFASSRLPSHFQNGDSPKKYTKTRRTTQEKKKPKQWNLENACLIPCLPGFLLFCCSCVCVLFSFFRVALQWFALKLMLIQHDHNPSHRPHPISKVAGYARVCGKGHLVNFWANLF